MHKYIFFWFFMENLQKSESQTADFCTKYQKIFTKLLTFTPNCANIIVDKNVLLIYRAASKIGGVTIGNSNHSR